MSRIEYERAGARQSWTAERTCDLCKKVEIAKSTPISDRPQLEQMGWATFSTSVRVNEKWESISLDFCPGCKTVLLDFWVEHGLDWLTPKSSHVYLDGHDRPVADIDQLFGKPMCVYRPEGKVGVMPCRRFRDHAGECSPNPEGAECPVCDDGTDYTVDDPPMIYAWRALEYHAQRSHAFEHTPEGWTVAGLGHFTSVERALASYAHSLNSRPY